MVAHAAILFSEEMGRGALLLRWLPSATHNDFAARWLAYMLPCRRFADVLADACARLGVDVATPSSQWTFTTYSLPVSRRTHCRYGPVTRRLPEGDVVDRLQSLGFPPPCYPNYGASDSCPGRPFSC